MTNKKHFDGNIFRLGAVAVILSLLSCLQTFYMHGQVSLCPAAMAQGKEVVAKEEQAKPVTATLISDSNGIVPGGKFKLGIKFDIMPGWHTYYKEPGDSGMPPSFDFEMPAGFKNGPIIWPKPHKTVDAGLVAYGYQNTVLHGCEITAPADLKEGDKITLKVKTKYLVCKDVCLPGKAELEITLPVVKSAGKSTQAPLFDALGAGFNDPVSTLSLSSDDGHNAGVAAAPAATGGTGGAEVGSPAPPGATAGSAGKFSVLDEKIAVPAAEQHENLASYIGLALVGGLILNIMPCVLPVIAIKVLSLLEQAKEEPARVKLLGLIFSAGIVSSFMVLALVVIGLKTAGQAIGWGFQFQYPGFVVAMSAVILMMALSLFGMFYVNVQASGSIDQLSRQEGLVGTFFKGVLATILSTPCSAPMLGAALGFAFSQPPQIILLIFFSVALGMSSPYLLLTINPAWMKFLPKPGDWMDKFKQGMGFLMLLTVIWLDYVLTTELPPEVVGWVNAWLVGLAFCAWIVANFSDLSSSQERRVKVLASAGGCLLLFTYLCIFAQPGVLAALLPDSAAPAARNTATAEDGGGGIVWQPFTLDSLNKELAEKKTVFLDFTADWCLTCKVNEKTVIATPEVSDKFKALNVVTMKADWTRQDPQITKLLSKFNRSGVPLYVIFPGSRPDQPIVFPEVITKELVLSKLDESAK
jgi:thiol:disulfide interchange protein DsbD